MRITLLTLLTVICCITTTAATTQASAKRVRNKVCPAYIYRITLTDKNKSPYSIDHPSRFLSRRSIERRKRQGLAIDSTDLPVSPHYIRAIENRQTAVIGQSRWNNTVLVEMRDTSDIQRIRHLPFVSNCRNVWQAPDSIEPTAIRTKFHDSFLPNDSIPDTMYGRAADQIQTTNGQRLHDIGYRGEGLTIAVLDGGFKNVNRIPAFSKVDIKGTRDFVFPNSPSVFYETDHGTRVLSIMAINTPYYYIGTAPQASYWLLRCEDPQSEQEVEEDYWAMAVEFADSVGCDLINSSLGYHQYDHGIGSHQLWQLDGHSTFISRTASMVIGKGIILVNSSGNTGMGGWKKLTFPADAGLSHRRRRYGGTRKRSFQRSRSHTRRTHQTRCCGHRKSRNHCYRTWNHCPGYGHLLCLTHHLRPDRLFVASLTETDREADYTTHSSDQSQ